jgi:hypothetical protein
MQIVFYPKKLRMPNAPLLGYALESPLSLENFDRLEYVIKAAIENVRQPKRRFVR